MTAGKIANALRFAIVAAMDRNGKSDGNASTRTRAGSFFYVSGLALEALAFLPRLGRHYRTTKAFTDELAPLQRDAGVSALRRGGS
jgi:hypothetical protein